MLSPIRRSPAVVFCLFSVCVVLVSFAFLAKLQQAATPTVSSLPSADSRLAPARSGAHETPLVPFASITVNSTSDVANGTDGLCTLREAITAAHNDLASGATPGECAAGSGADTISFTVTGTITLLTSLPQLGSNMSINGPGSNLLTIARSSAGGTPYFRIFEVAAVVNISGVTVTNGATTTGPSFSGPAGGGILNFHTLTLTDVIVSGNTTGEGSPGGGVGGAGGNGGGIYNSSGTLTMTSCVVSGNTAGQGGAGASAGGPGGAGGGIHNNGTLIMTDCSVTGNNAGKGGTGVAAGGNGGPGGGIYNTQVGASVSMTDCIVSGNNAGSSGDGGGNGAHGGGIFTLGGITTLTRVTLSNNSAGDAATTGVGGNGGAISIEGQAEVRLINSTVKGNQSGSSTSGFPGWGGGISNQVALTVTGSTIENNTTESGGGGIANRNVMEITNSTVSGNQASGSGAGIYDDAAVMNVMKMTNCTVTNHTSIGFSTSGAGTRTVRNSIIAGNGTDLEGSFTSQGNNLIGKSDGTNGFTNGSNGDQVGTLAAPLNPQLGLLLNNGGPTQTHALLAGSTAIDAGDNAAVTNPPFNPPPFTDQRGTGFNRIVDGNGDSTATVDIGAYEVQNVAVVTVAVSPASVVEDGATDLVYTFTRYGVTSGALTVNFSVGGTAAFGTDYTQSGAATFGATSGTVTFDAGNATATVTINPAVDSTVESNETAILTVTSDTGYNVGSPSAATGTITNDDTDVTLAVSPASVTEDGATNLVYTFTRTGVTTGALTVNFSVDGDAAFGTDYAQSGAATFGLTTGTVTFGAGNATATVTINPAADSTVELNETAILTVTSGTGYNVASPSAATGTITNDDTDVTLAVSPATVAEDDVTNLVYTFTRNGVTSGALTVNFSVGGTAAFSTDYAQSGAATFGATSGTVTFGAGNATATVTINPAVDSTVESDETAILTVTSGTGYNVASPSAATGTITNDDTDVTAAVSPSSVAEDGATNLVYTFTRTGVTSGALTVNFSVGGNAALGTDYTQTGAATFTSSSGTVTFGAGNSTVTVTIDASPDLAFEPNETVILTVTSGTGYNVSIPSQATGTITNDDPVGGIIRFGSATYNTTESSGSTTITVQRDGHTTQAVTVDYATPDDSEATSVVECVTINGLASPRCDFTTALGTLRFAAGETSKTFTILISQDNFVEGPETLAMTLSNLTGGAVFGVPSTSTLTIADDPSEPGTTPNDDPQNFVRQHYHDFLNREPDAAGLAFWTNQITSCGADAQCIEVRRIHVSASFFLSIEFQDTGYLVERLYKSSYGDATGNSTIGGAHTLPVPIVKFNEFIPDTQKLSQGVIVGQAGWEMVLESNKQAFVAEFVQRTRFATAYPTTRTPAAFVDELFANAGVTPTTTDRNAAIGEFGGAVNTTNLAARGRALRRVAENSTLKTNEVNRAFVLMQFFGYLRRNPNAAQDTDHSGYDFWLTKLNQFNGNFITAEMVKAFLTSIEYRHRFGP